MFYPSDQVHNFYFHLPHNQEVLKKEYGNTPPRRDNRKVITTTISDMFFFTI